MAQLLDAFRHDLVTVQTRFDVDSAFVEIRVNIPPDGTGTIVTWWDDKVANLFNSGHSTVN